MRRLRRASTKAKKPLWRKLRARQLGGVKFRKENPIGTYIVEVVCFEHKLVLEIDGGQHNASAGRQHDINRTAWLEAQGFRVLRFWNNHVLANLEGVLERTLLGTRRVELTLPSPLPSLVRVALDDGTVEVLMTSLLDTEEYPAKEFKGLYGKRWGGVETYFGRLKNLLEVERFSSRKVVGIEQDFYGIVFMSTLASVLMKEEEEAADRWSEERRLKYRYKVNRSVRYSALVDQVVDLLLNECKSSEEAEEELRTMLRRMWIPERPGRRTKRPAKSTSRQLRFQQYVKRIWT